MSLIEIGHFYSEAFRLQASGFRWRRSVKKSWLVGLKCLNLAPCVVRDDDIPFCIAGLGM